MRLDVSDFIVYGLVCFSSEFSALFGITYFHYPFNFRLTLIWIVQPTNVPTFCLSSYQFSFSLFHYCFSKSACLSLWPGLDLPKRLSLGTQEHALIGSHKIWLHYDIIATKAYWLADAKSGGWRAGWMHAGWGSGRADGKWRDWATLLSAYRPSLPLSCSHFEFLSSLLSTRHQLLTWWKLQHSTNPLTDSHWTIFSPFVLFLIGGGRRGIHVDLKLDSIPGESSFWARRKGDESCAHYPTFFKCRWRLAVSDQERVPSVLRQFTAYIPSKLSVQNVVVLHFEMVTLHFGSR